MTLTSLGGFILGVVLPALALLGAGLRWLISRKGIERRADSSAQNDALTSITEANASVANVVTLLMKPLEARVTAQAKQISEQAALIEENAASERVIRAELGQVQSELHKLRGRFSSMIRYMGVLRGQVESAGYEPSPVPLDIVEVLRDFPTSP